MERLGAKNRKSNYLKACSEKEDKVYKNKDKC
jgi:hypothetical protein